MTEGIHLQLQDGVDLELDVEQVDGVYRATAVTVKCAAGVTSSMLRGIPVATLVSEHAEAFQEVEVLWDELAEVAGVRGTDELRALKAMGPTDALLKAVAVIYRSGVKYGRAPAKEVEEMMKAPRTTVSKWIRKAREKGFLEA